MEINFRNALIVSAVLHIVVLAPFYNPILSKDAAKKETVVDYVTLKEPVKIKEAVKDIELKIPETPKVELKPKVETAPAPSAPTAKVEAKKSVSQEVAEKQAQIKTTKDYINYYQLIREKIRERVKRRYRSYDDEGEISLNFVLNSNGTLISSYVGETLPASHRKLADIAITSLKEASPFPPFPKALSMPEISFTVTVVFKKDR